MLIAIVAGVVLAALAFAMRNAWNHDESPASAPHDEGGVARSALDDDDEEVEEIDPDAKMPITTEGIAFIHDTHGLRLVRLLEPEATPPDWVQAAMDSSSIPYSVLNRLYYPGAAGGPAGDRKPGTPLEIADFTGARIVPGVAGEYAWRLETLGRDGDFGFFPFATRAGAEAALELLEHYDIIRRPVDEDGDPIPPSAEDFEEARSRYEETEAALAVDDDDDDEPPREGQWVSDRR
jgi:hypothetical protein